MKLEMLGSELLGSEIGFENVGRRVLLHSTIRARVAQEEFRG